MGALLREYKYLYECDTGEPYENLAELLERQELLYCTTNQDASFPHLPCREDYSHSGDFRYWQCKHTCTDEIYPNKEKVYELLDKIEGDRLPDDLIPRCSHCGMEMVPWWRSREVSGGQYYRKCNVIWIATQEEHEQEEVLFLRLGVV